MNFVVYAIQARSGHIYVGQTQDIVARLALHNAGQIASTRAERPWSLVKATPFATRNEARYFEWQLKRSRGRREKWLSASTKEEARR